MIVTLINASPRRKGATGQIIAEMAETIREQGDVDVRIYHLGDKEIRFCKGCMACYRLGECVIKEDDVPEILESIRLSDGVVFGTPTYVTNISGQLKTLLDRGHFVFNQALWDKYCFALSTYENAAGKQALTVLKRLFRYSGGIFGGSFTVKLDFGRRPALNEEEKKRLIQKTIRYYKMMREKSSKSLVGRCISFAALNFIIKPRLFKNRDHYAGTVKRLQMKGVL